MMAPSTSTLLAAAFLFTTSVLALPQKVDSAMPFLSSVATGTATSQQVWWTPSAASQEWNQWTVSKSSAAAVVTSSVSSGPSSAISVPYSNPFTIYTTMTNSLGVITGMPAVATSQPSQAPAATVCSGCASVLSAESSWSSMVASMYTTTTKAAAVSANSTASSSQTASATRSGFSQIASGNFAGRNTIGNNGAALLLVGAVAALL